MADLTDPYGIDIGLTETGDLAISPSGALVFSSGPENCVQALVMRMKTAQGELPLHPEYGSDLSQLIGAKVTDPQLAASHASLDLRGLVESDVRFLSAADIKAAAVTGKPQSLFVSCTLVLAAGDQLLVEDLADGRVSDVLPPDGLPLEDLVSFDDQEADFFALDDAELGQLQDANDTIEALTPDTGD